MMIVARVRRRGEIFHFKSKKNVYGIYLANVGRQEDIVVYW